MKDVFHLSDGSITLDIPESFHEYVDPWSKWYNHRFEWRHDNVFHNETKTHFMARINAIYYPLKLGPKRKYKKKIMYKQKVQRTFAPFIRSWMNDWFEWMSFHETWLIGRKTWATHGMAYRDVVAKNNGYEMEEM